MNNTKKTIGWCDVSWNPIVGCKHGCWYCYAKKLTQRFKKIFPNGFEPTFHPERLREPFDLKKPSKVFVCSIADLFAPWTPSEWAYRVFDSILGCPVKHTFQLLTKNPERINPTLDGYVHNWRTLPENVWVGTTVTGQNDDWKNIAEIKKVRAKVCFVSFEPLLGLLPGEICFKGLQWVIIGKLTGSKRVKLDSYWVARILNEARDHDIPVFIKNNVGWPQKIQEFPFENVAKAVAL